MSQKLKGNYIEVILAVQKHGGIGGVETVLMNETWWR